jgi:hypothetical protein
MLTIIKNTRASRNHSFRNQGGKQPKETNTATIGSAPSTSTHWTSKPLIPKSRVTPAGLGETGDQSAQKYFEWFDDPNKKPVNRINKDLDDIKCLYNPSQMIYEYQKAVKPERGRSSK